MSIELGVEGAGYAFNLKNVLTWNRATTVTRKYRIVCAEMQRPKQERTYFWVIT